MTDSQSPLRDTLDLSQLQQQVKAEKPATSPLRWVAVAFFVAMGAWFVLYPLVDTLTNQFVRIAIPIVIVSGALIFTLLEYEPRRQAAIKRLEQTHELLRDILPNLPTHTWFSKLKKFSVEGITSLFLWIVMFALLLDVQPLPQLAMIVGVLWALSLGWATWRFYLLYRDLPPTERRVMYGLAVSEITNYGWLAILAAALVGPVWLLIIPLLIVYLLFSFFRGQFFKRLYSWATSPLRYGDYERGIKRVQFARRIQPQNLQYITLEAAIMSSMLRFDESEPLYFSALSHPGSDTVTLAITVAELGELHMERGNDAQSLQLFETALRMAPSVWIFYLGVGDWYITKQIEGERALELVEYGVNLLTSQKGKIERTVYSFAQGKLAQAEALAGRSARANATLEKAAEGINPKMKREVARLAYVNGYVCEVRGESDKARQNYQNAMQLDPLGTYGHFGQKG